MDDFYQSSPQLKNQYLDDELLQSYLERSLPGEILEKIKPGLVALGDRTIKEVYPLGLQAEAQPPRHVALDPWGRRVDDIMVSDAWRTLEKISVEEKLIATAYQKNEGAHSRIHQFAKVYLYHASSAFFTCPLAMTDGAAKAIEKYGDKKLKDTHYKHLTSDDPQHFWTSGQWMTEKTGGSDLSRSATVAKFESGQYKLYGVKYFTSAITAPMAMTLARTEGAPEGSRGLSLFCVVLRDDSGRLQNIKINRLKDKLGTRALPTAEITLEGCPAYPVGELGNGVKKIASLFNITRIWNAACSVSTMRRGLALAHDYKNQREAFGKPLADLPLHKETLRNLELEWHAGFHLLFRVAELLGKEEAGQASEAEMSALRGLTPIVKLMTGKQAIAVSSEIIESFGGAGYMEDTDIPRLLRDAQTFSIWEGTTNVLSLDLQRAILKENALTAILEDIQIQLEGVNHGELMDVRRSVDALTGELRQRASAKDIESQARIFAIDLGRTYAAALMLKHAQWCLENNRDPKCVDAARDWDKKRFGYYY